MRVFIFIGGLLTGLIFGQFTHKPEVERDVPAQHADGQIGANNR